MTNVAEMFRHTVRQYGGAEAITSGEERISWTELYQRAMVVRNSLVSGGIRRGDIVAIFAPHSPAQIVALLGVLLADAAFTLVNPLLRKHQVEHQIYDCDARSVIGTKELLEGFRQDLQDRNICTIDISETGLVKAHRSTDEPPHEIEDRITRNVPTDVACIIYTSGSTGLPKGVVIPQRTLLDGARIVSGYLGITDRDVLIGLLPFNFDYGLNQLLTCLYKGARLVVHRYRMPNDLLDTLEKEGVTGMAAVPSLWPQVLNPRLSDHIRKRNLKLRYVTTAGGVHTQDLLRQLTGFFPSSKIIVMYGLTESFRSTYLPFEELFRRPGSIGKAVPEVEILVLNDQGESCKPGERGELIHRGAFVSYGYLNNPKLTDEKFVRINTAGMGCLKEVAVRSGDIVSRDEDGFIYFHGRVDAQIKCAGYRVSPGEVEEAILSFPGISQAAVFALPDTNLGQSVNVAYSTFNGNPIDEQALRVHVAEEMPTYAVPKIVLFYGELPLTMNGKIDYPRLKQEAGAVPAT